LGALERAWIIRRGAGPGLPEKYFCCDNGGEVVNETMMNFLQQAGIELKMTGSFSPQQNGINKRNHGSTDIMVTKFRGENPTMSLQEAVNRAAYARNCQVSATRGFIAFQMVYGRNPGIPGISECTTGSLEMFSPNKLGRKMIERMETARKMMNETEADIRLKIAMKDRLPREPNRRIEIGDTVTFRDHKEGKMRVGRVTGMDGSIAILKWCNHKRRVPARELMPLQEYRDGLEDGETDIDSAEELIEEIVPRGEPGPLRKRKVEIVLCLTDVQVEREVRERPLEEDVQSDESDHLPKLRVVTDSSEEERMKGRALERRKRKGKGTRRTEGHGRPKRWSHVRLHMENGEILEGRVTALEKSNDYYFFIDTSLARWVSIDLRDVEKWMYLNDSYTLYIDNL
jgi:hypothetical protein